MGRVGDAEQRPTGRGVPSHLPLLRQASAVQEWRTSLPQDDFRALSVTILSVGECSSMISVEATVVQWAIVVQ